ncbi:MAG: hypothetical protein HY363_04710 [Candidatus Aenigmarchaeota archaeon]|nr:hypothetical protein [Candidatus Aenigmarchaeota archaeon]
MKNVFLLFALIMLFVSCAKNERKLAEEIQDVSQEEVLSAEKLSLPEQPRNRLFELRAAEYSIDYGLKVSGPQPVQGSISVVARDFKETKYAKIVTTTRMNILGNEVLSAIYFLDEKGYSCVNQNVWECFELPAQQITAAYSAPGSQYQFEQYPDKAKFLGQLVIAGELASCYESLFEPVAGAGIITEYCYTSDGLPLSIKTTAGEIISEMTAASFSRTAADSAFQLPAEPKVYSLTK